MRYRIAGLSVEMKAGGRTARQGVAYLSADEEGPADMTVACNSAKVLEDCPELGNLDDAEYMGTGAIFARKLINFDGFQLHASAVEYHGRAYLFSAHPGVGKSTQTERWERLFGAVILNDDKPALRRIEGRWYVYGTPWSGKLDKSANRCAPLGGIAFLFRGEENRLERISPAQALPLMMSQTFKSRSQEGIERVLHLVDLLLTEIPTWSFTCRNEDEAAVLAREHMTKGEG